MRTDLTCPVCGTPARSTRTGKIDFDKLTGILKLVVKEYYKMSGEKDPSEQVSFCGNCRLIFRSRFFDEREIKIIYDRIYHKLEDKIKNEDEYVYNKKEFLEGCSELMYRLVRNTEKKHGVRVKTIYDIGGRDGFRLTKLADEGYDCTVFDPIKIKPCRPNIKKQFVWSSQIKSGRKADFIFLCNILEHSIHPRDLIRDCYKNLKEGGFLYVEVPSDDERVFDWLAARPFTRQNLMIDNTHYLFFTKKSMKWLLAANGFRTVSSDYFPLPSVKVKVLGNIARKEKKTVPGYPLFQSSLYDFFGSGYPLDLAARIFGKVLRAVFGKDHSKKK